MVKKDGLPDSIKTVSVHAVNDSAFVIVTLKNGKVRNMSMKEAAQKGYPIPPPPPPAPPAPPVPPAPPAPAGLSGFVKPDITTLKEDDIEKIIYVNTQKQAWLILKKKTFFDLTESEGQLLMEKFPSKVVVRADGDKGKYDALPDPLYIYAGLPITREQMEQIKPEDIAAIEVLKGENAIAAYGEKGKNGVIKIMPGNQEFSQFSINRISPNGEIERNNYGQKGKSGSAISFSARPVQGYEINTSGKTEPLFVLNGKIITSEEMKSIDPNSIERINVLKDKKAIEAYGPKGANGVVEIILKNTHEPLQAPQHNNSY